MDGGRISEARRYVTVGVCNPFICYDHQMCVDEIPFPVANELAQDALGRRGKSLDQLAEEIGYESASAFSTAFRRQSGCAPGAFARIVRAPRQPGTTRARSTDLV
jgi:AraC-like DNA-binding protein